MRYTTIIINLVMGLVMVQPALTSFAGDIPALKPPAVFDFEKDKEGWDIADWAGEQKDCVAKSIELSVDEVSKGKNSLKIMTDFPGDKWTQAPIEYVRDIDLTGAKRISADIFLPKQARSELFQARIIVTAGAWWFIEMKAPVKLEHGKWTTVTAKLDVTDADEGQYWRFKDKAQGILANLSRVRKLTVRVEYNASSKNAGAPYKGPVYIDNIVIE
ncbi:MAG: hypothetical protein PHS37_05100 [Candidatus Omnitrophica bacterium]|nr:hypothetical protein [Candidatus Omnitrophota bacterium]